VADVSVAFQRVCETFKIVDLNPFQREAMEYFVKKKVDVFVNLYRLGTAVNKSLGQRIIILQELKSPHAI